MSEKLNSYLNVKFFFFLRLSDELLCFHSDSMLPLSDKTLNADCFQTTNRIMCLEHKMLLKLNFFLLMERHQSCGSILTSKVEMQHAKEQWKKYFAFMYESSWSWTELDLIHIENGCCVTADFMLGKTETYMLTGKICPQLQKQVVEMLVPRPFSKCDKI